ncbi:MULTISPECIES: adenosine kinase [Acidiphilium]|jgi:fructokinase|uniref:adenosine kinase n=1 Tax=Acidiphilium TaxID=522 RepID=UPI001B8C23D7|nr:MULTISPECIES: adenosine kinase [Acidiphilium]MBS3023803.1 adenosine kinase [Acidiphilium multivorum]
MNSTRYDIIGIGNAIVDVIARTDDMFLDRHDMRKGAMRLIDAEAAERILTAMPPGQIASGGSVANSCAVAAGLGARTAFLGKVARDELGVAFAADLRAIGVDFPHAPLPEGAPTARCLILVTPDGQRTMNTYLGACIDFDHTDLDAEAIRDSSILYLEGYLFDPPRAQHAFREAARIARAAGRRVALSLSDAFCVDRHRSGFLDLIASGNVDILFANEAEICSLFEQNTFESAATEAAHVVPLAVLTRSEAGSVIVSGGERHVAAALPVDVVDTTGAGDAYAAGFMVGFSRNAPLAECAALGSRVAAAVIGRIGARPDLATLAALAPAVA